MSNQELLEYIKKQLAYGATQEQIKNILIEHKWPENDINEALVALASPAIQPSAPALQPTTSQEKPLIKWAKIAAMVIAVLIILAIIFWFAPIYM